MVILVLLTNDSVQE